MTGREGVVLGAVDKKVKEAMLRINEAIALLNNLRVIVAPEFDEGEACKIVEPACDT